MTKDNIYNHAVFYAMGPRPKLTGVLRYSVMGAMPMSRVMRSTAVMLHFSALDYRKIRLIDAAEDRYSI